MTEPIESLVSPSEHSELLVTQLNEMMQTSDLNDQNFVDLLKKCNEELENLKLRQNDARQKGDEEELRGIDKHLNSLTESVGLAQSLRITQKGVEPLKMDIPRKKDSSGEGVRRKTRRNGTHRRLTKDRKYPPPPPSITKELPAQTEGDGVASPPLSETSTAPPPPPVSPIFSNAEPPILDPFGTQEVKFSTPHWIVTDTESSHPNVMALPDAAVNDPVPIDDPFADFSTQAFAQPPAVVPASSNTVSASQLPYTPTFNYPPSPLPTLQIFDVVIDGLLKGIPLTTTPLPTFYLVATLVEIARSNPTGNPPTSTSVASAVQDASMEGIFVWKTPMELPLFKDIALDLYMCDLQILNGQTFLPFGHVFLPFNSLLDKTESRLSYEGVFEDKGRANEAFTVTASLKKLAMVDVLPSPSQSQLHLADRFPPMRDTASKIPAPVPSPTGVIEEVEAPSIPPQTERSASMNRLQNISLEEFLKTSKSRIEELETAHKEKAKQIEDLKGNVDALEQKSEVLLKLLLREKKLNAFLKGEPFDKRAFLDAAEWEKRYQEPEKQDVINGKTVTRRSSLSDVVESEETGVLSTHLLNQKLILPASQQLDWIKTPVVKIEKVINWPPSNISIPYGNMYKSFAYYRRLLSQPSGLLYEDDVIHVYFTRRIVDTKCVFKLGYKILLPLLNSVVVKPHASFPYGKFTMKPAVLEERMLLAGAKFQQIGWVEALEPYAHPPVLLLSYTLSDGICENIPLRLPLSSLFFCNATDLRANAFVARWHSNPFAKSASSLLCTVDPKYLGVDGYAFLSKALRFGGTFSILDSVDVGERSLVLAGSYPSPSTSPPELCLARVECGMKGEIYGFCRVEARCASTILLKALLALIVDSVVDYQNVLDWETQFLHSLK